MTVQRNVHEFNTHKSNGPQPATANANKATLLDDVDLSKQRVEWETKQSRKKMTFAFTSVLRKMKTILRKCTEPKSQNSMVGIPSNECCEFKVIGITQIIKKRIINKNNQPIPPSTMQNTTLPRIEPTTRIDHLIECLLD